MISYSLALNYFKTVLDTPNIISSLIFLISITLSLLANSSLKLVHLTLVFSEKVSNNDIEKALDNDTEKGLNYNTEKGPSYDTETGPCITMDTGPWIITETGP